MWLFLLARLVLGLFLALLSGTGLILNVLALVPVFRLAFVLRKNQVYIIAFFNMCIDSVQLLLTYFYLSPTIISHSYLISTHKKDKWTLLLGSIFMFCWYFETVTQMVMAINRFVIICLQKHSLFTTTSTFLIFLLLIPLCFLAMYTSQYSNPCCSFLFDQENMGWSYFEIKGVHNDSNDLDLPLNLTSSIVSSLCYICIFIHIHNNTTTQNNTRRKRDIRYAVQFSVILLSYIFAWSLFRVLAVIKDRSTNWNILIPICFVINCSSNAIIYLAVNCEVQSNAFPMSFRQFLVRFQGPEVNAKTTSINEIQVIPSVSVSTATVQKPMWSTRRSQPFRLIRLREAVTAPSS